MNVHRIGFRHIIQNQSRAGQTSIAVQRLAAACTLSGEDLPPLVPAEKKIGEKLKGRPGQIDSLQ